MARNGGDDRFGTSAPAGDRMGIEGPGYTDSMTPADAPVKVVEATGSEAITLPADAWVLEARFSQRGADLLINGPDGESLVVRDYFAGGGDAAALVTSNGAMIAGDVVTRLAGPRAPGQYAQADGGPVTAAEPIATVETLNGHVEVVRVDGTRATLGKGDPLFQGDVLETSVDGAIGVVFIDDSTLSLGARGRVVLDELTYDPTTQTGSFSASVLHGVFSVASGQIAKSGPEAMLIKTPVAVIGLRGTKIAGEVGGEGEDTQFSLLPDDDGTTGEAYITNATGTQVLGQPGATVVYNNYYQPPRPVVFEPVRDLHDRYSGALGHLPPSPSGSPHAADPNGPAPQPDSPPDEAPATEPGPEGGEQGALPDVQVGQTPDDSPAADSDTSAEPTAEGPFRNTDPQVRADTTPVVPVSPLAPVSDMTRYTTSIFGNSTSPLDPGNLEQESEERQEREAPVNVPPTTAERESNTPTTTTEPSLEPEPGPRPGTTDPTTEPGTTDPTTEPGTTDPGATDPGTDPGATDPGTDPGNTTPGTTPGATSTSGRAIDGYLRGATVWRDANRNGVLDSGEASTTTDASGNYTLSGGSGPIGVRGGTDIDTGLAFTGRMFAEASSGTVHVSPLTTLISQMVAGGTSLASATAQVQTAFGFSGDPSAIDPVASASTADGKQMLLMTTKLAVLMKMGSEALNAEGLGSLETAANRIFKAIADRLTSGQSVDLNDTTVLGSVLNTAAGTTGQFGSVATWLDSVNTRIDTIDFSQDGATVVNELARMALTAQDTDAIAAVRSAAVNGGAVDYNFLAELANVDLPGNDAPIVVGAHLGTTDEDTPFDIDLLQGASDADGDVLSVVNPVAGSGLTLTHKSGGIYTVTPDADWNGVATITYQVSDGTLMKSATATVTVRPVNDGPVTTAITLDAVRGTSMTDVITALDPDNDPLIYSVNATGHPSQGSVTLTSGGTWTYTPNATASGTDSFTYTVSDAKGGTATGTVTFAFTNGAPVSTGTRTLTFDEDTATPQTIDLLANITDLEGNSVQIIGGITVTVTPGSVADAAVLGITPTATATPGVYSITADPDWNGTAILTYTVSDGTDTAQVRASVTVTNVADDPVLTTNAVNDRLLVVEGASRNLWDSLLSATDADGDTVTFTLLSTGGTLKLNGTTLNSNDTFTQQDLDDGLVVYYAGATGNDTITFSYTDGTSTPANGEFYVEVITRPDYVWGGSSGSWHTTANWDTVSEPPFDSTNVTIDAGEALFSTGTTNLNNLSVTGGKLKVTGGSLTTSNGSMSGSAVLELAGGSFSGWNGVSPYVFVISSLLWSSGTLAGAIEATSATFTTGAKTLNGSLTLTSDATLANQTFDGTGTLTVQAGTLTIEGAVSVFAFSIGGDATTTIDSTVGSAASLTIGMPANYDGIPLWNAGWLSLSSVAGYNATLTAAKIWNSGIIASDGTGVNIINGQLQNNSDGIIEIINDLKLSGDNIAHINDGFISIDLATLYISGSNSYLSNSGEVAGYGTIALINGASKLYNSGTISPGGEMSTTATLSVTGDLAMSSTSVLDININASGTGSDAYGLNSNDVLDVNGQLYGNGIINLTVSSPSSLSAGQTFTILRANTFTHSSFDWIEGLESAAGDAGTPGYVFDVSFTGTELTLTARGVTVFGSSGADFALTDETINGNANTWQDVALADAGTDTVYGYGGDDIIFGQGGFDYLYGDDGEDTLFGGDDDDELYGGAGNDLLAAAGTGDDFFEGGAGDDTITFVYGSGSRAQGQTFTVSFSDGGGITTLAAFETLGTDTIHGWTTDDRIQLSAGVTPGTSDPNWNFFEFVRDAGGAWTSLGDVTGSTGGSQTGIVVLGAKDGAPVEIWYTEDATAMTQTNSHQMAILDDVTATADSSTPAVYTIDAVDSANFTTPPL